MCSLVWEDLSHLDICALFLSLVHILQTSKAVRGLCGMGERSPEVGQIIRSSLLIRRPSGLFLTTSRFRWNQFVVIPIHAGRGSARGDTLPTHPRGRWEKGRYTVKWTFVNNLELIFGYKRFLLAPMNVPAMYLQLPTLSRAWQMCAPALLI